MIEVIVIMSALSAYALADSEYLQVETRFSFYGSLTT